jgi:hypothetical protein
MNNKTNDKTNNSCDGLRWSGDVPPAKGWYLTRVYCTDPSPYWRYFDGTNWSCLGFYRYPENINPSDLSLKVSHSDSYFEWSYRQETGNSVTQNNAELYKQLVLAALQGLCSNPAMMAYRDEREGGLLLPHSCALLINTCFSIADTALAQFEKQTT